MYSLYIVVLVNKIEAIGKKIYKISSVRNPIAIKVIEEIAPINIFAKIELENFHASQKKRIITSAHYKLSTYPEP